MEAEARLALTLPTRLPSFSCRSYAREALFRAILYETTSEPHAARQPPCPPVSNPSTFHATILRLVVHSFLGTLSRRHFGLGIDSSRGRAILSVQLALLPTPPQRPCTHGKLKACLYSNGTQPGTKAEGPMFTRSPTNLLQNTYRLRNSGSPP